MKIEFRNVSFSYEDSDADVLNNVSFIIESNKMTSIIGKNGSGKSTIAKLIMGLIKPKSGHIYIDDEEYNEKTIDRIRPKIGIIFQNPDNQFVGVTVKDDIAFGLENSNLNREEMLNKIDKYSKMVSMNEFLNHNPEELSGGQKQRVALAGVLAMETDTIIFDEATSMLDPKGVKEIGNIIKNLKSTIDKTIITITHNIEEVITSDNIIIIDDGNVVKIGSPREVLSNKSLLDQLGLDTPVCISLINLINESAIENKEKWEELLWELAFKM